MLKNDIRETKLPGVGVQHDFQTEAGNRIGVITHHNGRRDVLVFDEQDPDMCQMALQLTEDEARVTGQMLGAAQVAQSVAEIHHFVGGLNIDWVTIGDSWGCIGQSIKATGLDESGISVVAVVRGETTIAAPPPEFELMGADVLVIVGSPEGLLKAHTIIQGN
jgi:TrkA domain protein